jgi:hypothetical protein
MIVRLSCLLFVALAVLACNMQVKAPTAGANSCLYGRASYPQGESICQDNKHIMKCATSEEGDPKWDDTGTACDKPVSQP